MLRHVVVWRGVVEHKVVFGEREQHSPLLFTSLVVRVSDKKMNHTCIYMINIKKEVRTQSLQHDDLLCLLFLHSFHHPIR